MIFVSEIDKSGGEQVSPSTIMLLACNVNSYKVIKANILRVIRATFSSARVR